MKVKAISDKVKARQGQRFPASRARAHSSGTSNAIVPTEGLVMKYEGGSQPALHVKLRLGSRQDCREFAHLVRKGGLGAEVVQSVCGDATVACVTSDTVEVSGRGCVWVKVWGTVSALDALTNAVICLAWELPGSARVGWQGMGSAPAEFVRPYKPSADHHAFEGQKDKRALECKSVVGRVFVAGKNVEVHGAGDRQRLGRLFPGK